MSGALRGFFAWGKADDAGVLSPGKEENVATRKKDRKDWTVFKFGGYISPCQEYNMIHSKKAISLLLRIVFCTAA